MSENSVFNAPFHKSKNFLSFFLPFLVAIPARAKNFKVWKDDNHAIELDISIDAWNKINYIHDNPVRVAWVDNTDEYIYSSARDYADKKGLVILEKL